MTRKRKLFLGEKPIGRKPPIKSLRKAREVTSIYHAIQKNLAHAQTREEKEHLQTRLEEMGGVQAYQEASIVSTQRFNTSRWVVSTLQKLGKIKDGSKVSSSSSFSSSISSSTTTTTNSATSRRLKTLEVGAISIQLQACSFLDVKAIDLNSQHPRIEQMDFFDLLPNQAYDVVVCSMVINCVPTHEKRGEMLARLRAHLCSNTDTGILFLSLPRRCIDSKNVGGVEAFASLLGALGFVPLQDTRLTPKVAFFVLGCRESEPNSQQQQQQQQQGMAFNWQTFTSSIFIASLRDNPNLSSKALAGFMRHNEYYASVLAASPNEFLLSVPLQLRGIGGGEVKTIKDGLELIGGKRVRRREEGNGEEKKRR